MPGHWGQARALYSTSLHLSVLQISKSSLECHGKSSPITERGKINCLVGLG